MASVADLFADAVRHFQAGRPDEAEPLFRRALAGQPGHAGGLYYLGVIAYRREQFAVAANYFRQAVAANPREARFHSALGAAHQALAQFAEAALAHQQALALRPDDPEVLNNLGITLVSQRREAEAVAAFRKALQITPHDPEVLNNLAAALKAAGKPAEAVPYYRQALRLQPTLAQAHHNLGNALEALGELDEAVACYRETVRLKPDFGRAWQSLGVAVAGQGRLAEAQYCFKQAIRARPDDPTGPSTLLYCRAFDPAVDPTTLQAEHRAWGETLPPAPPPPAYANTPNPDRRLRVGYVSPDFRAHAASYFIEPLLAHHDRAAVEVFAYADVPTADATTARLRGLADQWRDTVGLADDHVAELVRQDGIDLLVDLAGHTSGNRLGLFARRPAPVQLSYLGYPYSTGLPTIDYRLVDAVTDPPGEPAPGPEELVPLDRVFCCYAPPRHAPPVAPPPAADADGVTFGSTHKLEKLNDAVLDLWARLLRQVPSARLLLARHVLHGQTATDIVARIAARGVARERLLVRRARPVEGGHLRAYVEIDVALDPFPWSGHTTACEALWMGVPVVTLRGRSHAGRMVASILGCLGLSDLVAETPDDYVRIATALAADHARRAELRAGLRRCMLASPLCDGPRFTRGLEAAYRGMWRRWCASPAP